MTITELTDLLFHDPDSTQIFLMGFKLQATCEIMGIMIATIRLMRKEGNTND